MVGKEKDYPPTIFLWQPHDFRLYFDFSKENFTIKKPSDHALQEMKGMVGDFNCAYNYTSCNHNSEHKYEKFMYCTIRVKKNQVELTNNSHQKQWRKITANSIDEVDKRIDEVMEDLKQHSINALKVFIKLHGGKSNFTILKMRNEHGIHGDKFLDKIPPEMIINDTYFKKVYANKVEFKSVAAIKNYVSNRAIEKIAPDMAIELNKINLSFEQTSEVLNKMSDVQINLFNENEKIMLGLQEQIKSHLALIQEYRNEALSWKKPFFIRWWEWFKVK